MPGVTFRYVCDVLQRGWYTGFCLVTGLRACCFDVNQSQAEELT